MTGAEPAQVLALALLIDALWGDPSWLFRRVPHPVVVIGALIDWLDRTWNRAAWSTAVRRWAGVQALAVMIAVPTTVAVIVVWLLSAVHGGWLAEALLMSTLIAQRSLYDHVGAVAEGLEEGGLADGRVAVASLVGRDPDSLDEAGVARAAIESCAESFSDGVVAPVFWAVLLGLPGIVAYKAINTADSMIGYRTPRYLAFGWASARLDDLINLLPARLAGTALALGAMADGGGGRAFKIMWRDAARHRSPNAGWPEAAMAGALGLALAGPRSYGGTLVDDAWMGAGGRRAATGADIRRALILYRRACLLAAGAALLSLLLIGG